MRHKRGKGAGWIQRPYIFSYKGKCNYSYGGKPSGAKGKACGADFANDALNSYRKFYIVKEIVTAGICGKGRRRCMISNQVIQTSIDELKAITKIDLGVYDMSGAAVALSAGWKGIDVSAIKNFAESQADSQVIGHSHLFKVLDDSVPIYVLVAQGTNDEVYMVGKIAVSQLQNLIVAYKERFDRNTFFQSLILDNMLLVDIYNRAKKLHIEPSVPRVVYVVEVQTEKDNVVTEILRSMYSAQAGDFVTAVDEKNIILIKSLSDAGKDNMQSIAETIVTMMNTEALLKVRVAYGSVVNELKEVSKSYKEAKMALDVGKIFYIEREVLSYGNLGIGRLIYQLPVNLCRMYIREIFGDEIPSELDDETLATLNKFFENNLNVSETSKQLFVHRNTLVYRIEKIQKATGLNLRNFDDALTFKIALMVVNYMDYIDAEKN